MKCRKFQKIKENRQTSSRVIPTYWGMAWGCCLFYLQGTPTTYNSKISFQHHAFFVYINEYTTIKVLDSKIRTQTIKSYYNEKTFYDSFNRRDLFVELFL